MNVDDPLVLYIILRQSLSLDNNKTAYYAANAVQFILMKYFTLQVLAVKTNLNSLVNDTHVKMTTNWLASRSLKSIITVNDDIWENIKQKFNIGTDLFCLKDPNLSEIETTLVFWPIKYSNISSFFKNLNIDI